jgi:hypothetical protein
MEEQSCFQPRPRSGHDRPLQRQPGGLSRLGSVGRMRG